MELWFEFRKVQDIYLFCKPFSRPRGLTRLSVKWMPATALRPVHKAAHPPVCSAEVTNDYDWSYNANPPYAQGKTLNLLEFHIPVGLLSDVLEVFLRQQKFCTHFYVTNAVCSALRTEHVMLWT
jgi:hypothetical protein